MVRVRRSRLRNKTIGFPTHPIPLNNPNNPNNPKEKRKVSDNSMFKEQKIKI
jgi:hypothetical protein